MKHILVIIVLIALVIASWSIRLQNPTLTETQLLIEYWPLWLAIVAVELITAWWYKSLLFPLLLDTVKGDFVQEGVLPCRKLLKPQPKVIQDAKAAKGMI